MDLLSLLNSRANIAAGATKDFHEEMKRNLDDYEAKSLPSSGTKKTGVYNRHVASSRYDITIPYIFATHESMTSSFFENMPDIVITGRTAESNKVEILKSIYNYIVDVADLDEFLGMSAWWFFLVGMCKADVEYSQVLEREVPQLDAQGQPMLNDDGKPVLIPVYSYNDPKATVDNLLKVNFSPESEFSIDAKKVPYYLTESLMEVDEIKDLYDIEVEPDATLEVDNVDDKNASSDLKRVKVMRYYGKLPSGVKDDKAFGKLKLEWSFKQNYKIYFTKQKVLFAEMLDEKPCKLARLYAKQNCFYGFGIGKTLRPFQEDMSIRRSQELAYADRFAFPWLLLPGGTKVDQKALQDYKKTLPLTYTGEAPPSYLSPPNMPSSVTDADNAMRSDAQFVSGTLDLSKGAQQTNTVKTATGQQLFAQGQDKRLNKARKSLAKYYREVIIQMFKLARDNWDGHKTITYQDDQGQDIAQEVTADDLQNIDFDTDIDFNLDSVSVNQDIMSQRWLSLLQESVNVPVAKLDQIYKKVLRESFKIGNPDNYVKTPEEIQAETAAAQGLPAQPPAQQPMDQVVEQPPAPQSLGSQLAPEVPNGGQMGA